MLNVKLDRPLAIFDIEATGTNIRTDRIVELAVVKILPAEGKEVHVFRVNPEMPIPAEAAAIHGITDADVAHCPPFKAVAPKIFRLFDGCDLGGYNVLRYDIPLLQEEFTRASLNFTLEGRRVLDAQRIFHRKEPRDLTAALSFYCGEMHVDAHGAEADALATLRVIEGQFARYPDLPQTMEDLDAYCNPRDASWVDREGRLKIENGEIVLNFGKKKGESLKALARNDPGFLKWMLKGDFPSDTKEHVRKALSEYRADPIGAMLGDMLGSGGKPTP
jgi:DNA polymerase-3 subunit epsilon